MAARKKYPEGTKIMSLYMPPDLKAALVARAESTSRTSTEVIHDLLRRELMPSTDQKGAFG